MRTLFAGVDLGGTAIKAAIADESGTILADESLPTESHLGPRAVVDHIAEMIESLRSRIVDRGERRLAAVGMGVPGLVDVRTGTTKFLPNLPTHWRDVPVAEWLTERFDCPVRLLNDVRTATLAELRFGHGREQPRVTLVFFALGTGVGGGIVIDGRLRLGPLGAAGELGHQTILPDGLRCGCGNRGCLETLASGPAIAAEGIRLMRMGLAPRLHELTSGHADQVTTREMALAADHDPLVREAIVRAAGYVGIAAANVIITLHPDLIVLGGGVAEIGDLLTTTVKQVITERVGMIPTADILVERSPLGNRAGMLGAVALAIEAQSH